MAVNLTPAVPRRRGPLQEGPDARGQARRAQGNVGDPAQAQGEREGSGRTQDEDFGTHRPDRARQDRPEEGGARHVQVPAAGGGAGRVARPAERRQVATAHEADEGDAGRRAVPVHDPRAGARDDGLRGRSRATHRPAADHGRRTTNTSSPTSRGPPMPRCCSSISPTTTARPRRKPSIDRLKLARRELVPPGSPPPDDPAVYALPTLLVANKCDDEAADIRLEIARETFGTQFPLHVVSAERGDGLAELRKAIYDVLGVMRVYTKQPGKPAGHDEPVHRADRQHGGGTGGQGPPRSGGSTEVGARVGQRRLRRPDRRPRPRVCTTRMWSSCMCESRVARCPSRCFSRLRNGHPNGASILFCGTAARSTPRIASKRMGSTFRVALRTRTSDAASTSPRSNSRLSNGRGNSVESGAIRTPERRESTCRFTVSCAKIYAALPRIGPLDDGLDRLHSLHFVRGDPDAVDFWSFVQHCRKSVSANPRAGTPEEVHDHHRPPTGWYQMVSGPVAAFWEQKALIAGSDQFSFHEGGTYLLDALIAAGKR